MQGLDDDVDDNDAAVTVEAVSPETPPRRTVRTEEVVSSPLESAKRPRKHAELLGEIPFSPHTVSFGVDYDRQPTLRTPVKNSSGSGASGSLRRVDSAAGLLLPEEESSLLKEVFARLAGGVGFLRFAQCLDYLCSQVRDSLEVPWNEEDFARFAAFHIGAVCSQSHAEQDMYSFDDFATIVGSLRAVDNEEFIGVRLFRRSADTQGLRDSMKLVWTKAGEIVQSQGSERGALIVLYHGSAVGSRVTSSGRIQQIVQVPSGQVMGLIEMILEVPALLTLSMETEGTVLRLPVDGFQAWLKTDEALLWNVMYETLTEISRISQFIHAAPFPKVAAEENLPVLEPDIGGAAVDEVQEALERALSPPRRDSSASAHRPPSGMAKPRGSLLDLSSQNTAMEVLERVFGISEPLPGTEMSEFRVITLKAGAPLYEKGSRAVALWLLLDGTLDLPAHLMSSVNGVRVVGEMGLLTRQDRSRTVCTVTRCDLLRISLVGLHALVRRSQDIMWKLARPALANVVSLLAQITVGFEHRVLRSGKQLYQAGDPSENLYILINGRLRILNPDGSFRHDVSKPGESVGEMSLLAGMEHGHSCFAVRDSELLVLNREAFQAVLEEDPQQYVGNLFRMVRERTTASGSKFGHKPNLTKTVAILSTSEAHVDTFTERLYSAIHAQGYSVRLITGEMIGSRFPAVKKVDDMLFSRGISYYIHNQEEAYDYVLCLADHSSNSVWTRWVLRQVDLVLVVGYHDEDPNPSLELELGIYATARSYRPEVQLVLLHNDPRQAPFHTDNWLRSRKVARHHHLVVDRAADYQRLARIITGNSVGLVLSGGGARGIAHLGAIRALLESGVPIDMACGTSMGSQVAALVACEYSLPEIALRLENFYLRGYFRTIAWDLTLPLLSIMTGEAFSNRMKRLLGEDLNVEDTWLSYFAVSTNLTTRSAHVHKSGSLWKAARAASSLPLLFPPVVCEEGVLMDGGLINNVPVDVARHEFGCDIIIAIDVSSPGELPDMPYSTHASGWWVLLQRLMGKPQASGMELLLYLTQMVDEATRSERLAEADVSIRPDVSGFGMLDFSAEVQLQLLQRGHAAALQALQKAKSNRQLWDKLANQVEYRESVYAHHQIKASNQWRKLAMSLITFLGLMTGWYWRRPLGKIWSRLLSYISIFSWGNWLDETLRF